MPYKMPNIMIHHAEVNDQVGRISLDGIVDGKPVAVVFLQDEVPKSVKTDTQMHEYMVRRLKEAATPQGA